MSLLICILFPFSISYAQEESEEDKVIDLPPVKIEIVDATQLNIPKEKFHGFAKPGSELYVTLGQKERLWYLPPISIPEKVQQKSVKPKEDFLFSLSAYPGIPAALTYQMLLVKGFGKSQALLDVGRSMLRSERSAKLVSDPSKKQGNSTTDKFRGLFAYENEVSTWKTDLTYKAKSRSYLDLTGDAKPNNRSLLGLSADWNQKQSEDIRTSLNIDLSRLEMEGHGSPEPDNGLDLRTDFCIRTFWPRLNPIDTGLGIEYFDGDGNSEKFRETILRLYLRDSHIRIWPFVLGAGIELALDTHKSSLENGEWNSAIYPNPHALFTSQIGSRTILQFGLERYIIKHALEDLYLNGDYVRFNPGLRTERAWHIHASLQYRLMPKINVIIGAFDKEISNLTIFKRMGDSVISWVPSVRKGNAHIFGLSTGCELSFMDERLKLNFAYMHEFHDTEEHIPYRPKDKSSLTVTYLAPYGLDLSLSGEFYGPRYTDTNVNTLSRYFLCKPGISKSFGKNAITSLSAELYFGEDDYQVWEEYGLPRRTVDLGLTVKF